jgi:hypothetical protein
MPMPLAALPRIRCALLVAALLAAPALASAQRRSAPASRVEAVVVTVPAIRVRTAPSFTSLSIDDFTQGTVFPLAPEEYQSSDWYGVMIDGRIAYLPRNAAAPRARGSRAVIAEPVEMATVTQAGAPVAAEPAPAVEREPAPVASRPAPAEPAATRQPAPVTTQAAAAPAATPAPERVAEQPAPHPAAAAPSATPAEKKADQPNFNARRAGLDLTLGLLGSVTPIKSTTGLTPSAHISGLSFLGVRYRGVGVYGAPEYGQGGGYRSTMFGGGVSLDLISLHLLRVSALGGYTMYTETTMPTDSTVAPVTAKLQGPSVGGMVSIPFIGPMRLAYRGQYVMAQVAGVPQRMTRHSVGLVF